MKIARLHRNLLFYSVALALASGRFRPLSWTLD